MIIMLLTVLLLNFLYFHFYKYYLFPALRNMYHLFPVLRNMYMTSLSSYFKQQKIFTNLIGVI